MFTATFPPGVFAIPLLMTFRPHFAATDEWIDVSCSPYRLSLETNKPVARPIHEAEEMQEQKLLNQCAAQRQGQSECGCMAYEW